MRLTGRDPVLHALSGMLAQARSGLGQLVLVGGEAGIGKTAVLAAMGAAARSDGCLVLRGQCWDGPGAAPFWPWVQVLRSAAQHRPGLDLGAARVLVQPADPGAPMSAGADAGRARFDLLDAAAGALITLSAEQPLLVVLDDLHWADEGSWSMLEFAARHLQSAPVLVLVTCRDDETAAYARARRAASSTIELHGLDEADVARLAAQIGGSVPGNLAELHARTGGNPLFVGELVRLALAAGTSGTGWRTPDSVRDAIQRRLVRLSQPCVRMLRQAAAFGSEFDADVLIAALDPAPADPDVVPGLLAEAEAIRMLTADPAAGSGWRFAHDLYRESLLADQPASARAAFHARAATALQTARAAGRTVSSAEIAAQLLAAAEAGRTELSDAAADAALAGAGLLRRTLAFEDAARLYGKALALRSHLPVSAAPEQLSPGPGPAAAARIDLRLHLGLAAAMAEAGRPEARDAAVEAAEIARQAGNHGAYADAALLVHAAGSRQPMSISDSMAMLRVAAAADLDDVRASRVWAAIARQLHHAGMYGDATVDEGAEDEVREAAARAVGAARRSDDPAALAFALLARHDSLWRRNSAADRLPVAREMAAAARDAGDLRMAAQATLLIATALLEQGRPEGVAALGGYCQQAEAAGDARGRYGAASRRVTLALCSDDVTEVPALAEAAHRAARRIREPDADGVLGTQLAALACVAGPRFVRAPDGDGTPFAAAKPILDTLHLAGIGDLERAQGRARDIALSTLPVTHDLEVLVYGALAVWLAGDADARAEAYRLLAPYSGLHAVVGGCAAYAGSVDLHLGRLAAALGDEAAARSHLTAAAEHHQRLGAGAWARVCRDLLGELPAADLAAASAAGRRPAAAAGNTLAAGDAPPAADGQPTGATFHREGDVWRIEFAGQELLMRDAKGLQDLWTLLGSPGTPIPAAALFGGAAAVASQGADPVLDDSARRAYRGRLDELGALIDEAAEFGDDLRADRLRSERDALVHELAAAVGLGGRPRRLGEQGERARSAVTARIHQSLARIERENEALGRHLRNSVSTGRSCCYAPAAQVHWQL